MNTIEKLQQKIEQKKEQIRQEQIEKSNKPISTSQVLEHAKTSWHDYRLLCQAGLLERKAVTKNQLDDYVEEIQHAKTKRFKLNELAQELGQHREYVHKIFKKNNIYGLWHNRDLYQKYKLMCQHYKPDMSGNQLHTQALKIGLFNRKQAAKWLGIPLITLDSWHENGSVEKPKREYRKHYFYNEDDMRQIIKLKSVYFKRKKKRSQLLQKEKVNANK